MDRLQKKCFMAATGMHVLLALILLFGSAFMSRTPKSGEIQFIDITPTVLTDGNIADGGNPKADRTPAPRVVTPPAPPKELPPPPIIKTQTKAVDPDPTPVKEQKADPDSVEPAP